MPINSVLFSNPIKNEFTLTPINPIFSTRMKSLFTDNSIVFYKKGALSSGGIGTVRNSSTKSKKI